VTKESSLARRVVVRLIMAQLVAFAIGGLLTVGLELSQFAFFRLSWDEMATHRVSKLVIDSLTRGADGIVRIEPNAKLQAELRRTPSLKFAAFDEARSPLPGSSLALVSTLTKAGVIQITHAHLHFNLPGDPETTPLGYMERRRTPFGWLHIATYRQRFRWSDIFIHLFSELSWGAAIVVSVLLLSAATAWFAVRGGLTPLHAAAREAERIDFDSLERGVIAENVPIEIKPFVGAINAALARLDASGKRMRRYTANAAHELRTPLAVLRARLENADESPIKGPLLLDASRLRAIVEQMLIAARLTERQAPLDQHVDLVETIRQVVADYTPLVIECDRRIEFEAMAPSVIVRGNRRAIESIVANLIDNALRAEPVDGMVLARVRDDAVVEVIDHGEGVSEADREMIFEPFWRKSDATPGTGLGLAIAKELMEKLQGRIWVEETRGGGATFKLWLPVVISDTLGNVSNAHSSSRMNALS
jgi:two-component system OmpR family sensor kinase